VLGETNPEGITVVSDFAPSSSEFTATITVTNNGSSTIPNVRVTIYWPLRAPEGRYYLYTISANDQDVRHITIQWNFSNSRDTNADMHNK